VALLVGRENHGNKLGAKGIVGTAVREMRVWELTKPVAQETELSRCFWMFGKFQLESTLRIVIS
jgi:hypothetical protein